MRPRGGRLRAAVATASLLVSILGAPTASATVTTADRLLVDSLDDYLGQGERSVLTDADTTFLLSGTPSVITVTVQNPDVRWSFGFSAPVGQTLQVGHYAGVNRFPSTTAGLDIGRDSSGCNSSTSTFTIQELTLDGSGNPLTFAATFVHWCEGNLSGSPLVGMLRVNSDAPQAVIANPHTSRAFGNVTVGETSDTRTFSVEILGDFSVHVSSVDVAGDAADDFPLSSNACSNASLDPGDTCTFDATFVPSVIEGRAASFVIANDAPEGDFILPIGGYGRIPTTTSVHVEPDLEFFPPGLKLVAAVTPQPNGNDVECWYDGALVGSSGVSSGTAFCLHERELGVHTFSARYEGSWAYGDSASDELSFTVSAETTTTLELSKSTVGAGAPITLTATVGTASDLLYPGGSVTFRDATTNQTLGAQSVTFGSASVAMTASFSAGSHQIEARYSGVDGVLDASSDSATLTVLPDTVAPTTSTPTLNALVGAAQTPAGGLPIRLSWTGSDNLSGIAHYDVQRQVDGGPWSTTSVVTSAHFDTILSPSHDYRFRVRPIDYAGNLGAWRYTSNVRFRRYPEYAASAHYSSSWKKATGPIPWWGGTAMSSSAAGARARFTLTGRSFAWLGLYAPSRGKARIYVDGVYKATVDLYAASQKAQVIAWSKSWATSATRIVEIRVLGTVGRPRVDVDGFWVGT